MTVRTMSVQAPAQTDMKLQSMSSPAPIVVVVEEKKRVCHTRCTSRDRGIGQLVPTQGITVVIFIVIALLLKAEEAEDIVESLRIATEVVRPLLAPVVLAVCGFLILEMTSS